MSNDPPVVRGKSGNLEQPSTGDDAPSFRQLAAVWFRQSMTNESAVAAITGLVAL